ncbi:MAG: hypothetical protein M1483_06890 [Actinobacteria bacterium]|jgi:GT2 family glycosyltransferase|nr:hypothetical protein [Actinomycetota bacterium]MCL6105334.1 hypothetical protein [Actinomycetota bacterium]
MQLTTDIDFNQRNSPSLNSVAIQVVLFNNSYESVEKLLRAVSVCIQNVVDAGITVQVFFGDCSALPVLSDNTLESQKAILIRSGADRVVYEVFDSNLGHGGGHNRLAKLQATSTIVIMNPDVYPAPKSLNYLLEAFYDPAVGIAEARQIPLEHPKDFDIMDGTTSWATGTFMAVRREAFDLVKGFDSDNFFLHCDDVDFSWRVRLAGYKIIHVPKAVIFHDKHPAWHKGPKATAVEIRQGLAGRLMLAWKMGRTDIVEQTLADINANPDAGIKKVAAQFIRKRDLGELPLPIPNANTVAEFVDGNYGPHRF